jgi:hypothetical protein
VVVAATRGGGGGGGQGGQGPTITLSAPLTRAHAVGAPVAGTGITLSTALTRAHDAGAQLTEHLPTPGAPNQYSRRAQ